MNWFAVMTQPNREALAENMLKLAKVEYLFPHYVEWRALTPNAKRTSYLWKRPYFTGYLFVRVGLGDIGRVNDLAGVREVIYDRNAPLPIPETFIDKLMDKCDLSGALRAAPVPAAVRTISPGDRVRFKEGTPLWGFAAEVRRVMGKQAVVELERLLGTQREVQASTLDLEKVLDDDSPLPDIAKSA
jgi:transcription antitermination factor NusG